MTKHGMGLDNASQFVNGKPMFSCTKMSDVRQQGIIKKEDSPEGRELRLELYRVRLEAGLDIFSGNLKGEAA